MSSCLPCHDGESATVDCDACHTGDIGRASQSDMRDYPKLAPMGEPTTCRGCHRLDECNECHGLELPHSPDFVASGHAREAGFYRKELCIRCHDVSLFCNACHRFDPDGDSPHAGDFFSEHPYEKGCGCHGLAREVMCALCHD